MKYLVAIAALLIATPSYAADRWLGCFSRTYDRAHLARHPDQLVTAIKFRIKRPPPDMGSDSDYWWFNFEAKVRGRNKSLQTGGGCNERGPGLQCNVDCDGGGVEVSLRGGHLMMYLNSIRVAECGKEVMDDDSAEALKGGKDDRVFRLDRVSDAVCRKME